MPEVISLGPLALPPYIIPALLAVGAAMAALRFGVKDQPLREAVDRRFSLALIVALLIWKLSPLVAVGPSLLLDPVSLLRLPGGQRAALIAVAIGFAILGWPTLKRAPEQRRPVALIVTVSAVAAILGNTLLAGLATGPNLFADGVPQEMLVEASWPELNGPPGPIMIDERPVVITVWATWCGPCRADIPVKRAVAEEYGVELAMVGINLTTTEGGLLAVREYADAQDLPYRTILDLDGRLANAFAVRGTPTTIVIDRHLQVVDRWVGPSSTFRLRAAVERARSNGDAVSASPRDGASLPPL